MDGSPECSAGFAKIEPVLRQARIVRSGFGSRNHPLLHPSHVSGGLMVHMTGMVGFVHAYYVFNLRHADGWVGYGVRIHHARFHNLAATDVPLVLKGWTTHARKSPAKILARYQFEFTQGAKLIYEGDQTALWTRVTAS